MKRGIYVEAVAALIVVISTGWVNAVNFWEITTVDTEASVGRYTSLAILPSGYPAISYQDYSNYDLKYAWFDGATWQTTTVDAEGNTGLYTSLAILPSGYPAISYQDYLNYDLKYAWFDGATWQTTTVDAEGYNGYYTSLAILPSGHPAISYQDGRWNYDLKYAWFDGSTWHNTTVDTEGRIGYYTSLAILPSGHPAISYQDFSNYSLKYAWFDGVTWQKTTVDTDGFNSLGNTTSLAILPSGHPAISYQSWENNDLKYAWFDGVVWQTTTVDAFGTSGSYISLTTQPSGYPAISYQDYSNDLRYAWFDGATWQTIRVNTLGDTSVYSSLAILPSGDPAISYLSNHHLKYAVPLAPSLVETVVVDYTATADTDLGGVVTVIDGPAYSYGIRLNSPVPHLDVPAKAHSRVRSAVGPSGHWQGEIDLTGNVGEECMGFIEECIDEDPETGECLYWDERCESYAPIPSGDSSATLTGTLTLGASTTHPPGTLMDMYVEVVQAGTLSEWETFNFTVFREGVQIALIEGVNSPIIDENTDVTRVIPVYAGEMLTFECFAGEYDFDYDEPDLGTSYNRTFLFQIVVPDFGAGGDIDGDTVTDDIDNCPFVANSDQADCDSNGQGDLCQPEVIDCNSNGSLDVCDIANGTSWDANTNGVPDECEIPSAVVYVDDDATDGLNDGSSWVNAFKELSDALIYAESSNLVTEIHVASGTYKPSIRSDPETPRTETFQLINGITIRGGYRGLSGSNPNERAIALYETVLSGDLSGNDNPADFPTGPSLADNSYKVVTGSSTNTTAVLDGVTITAGNADAYYDWSKGGGMYLVDSNPTLTNCTFISNSAKNGGGMYFINSSPTLVNCTFTGNSVEYSGGGIFLVDSSPTLTNCTFTGNSSKNDNGGGMSNHRSTPTVTNCTFRGNSANDNGGGMNNHNSFLELINCTFSCNSASFGGGIYSDDSILMLTNCPFSGNSANSGGGIYSRDIILTVTNCTLIGNSGYGINNSTSYSTLNSCTFAGNSGAGLYYDDDITLSLSNCIFWGNTEQIRPQNPQGYGNSTLTTSYSYIQGGWIGEDNIDVNPLLTPDGHLQSNSPCINVGDVDAIQANNESDIDGDPRIHGDGVDIGGDEFIDSDGNDLPDWWETRYSGANDPAGDPDNDGVTNIEECNLYISNPLSEPVYVDKGNAADPNQDGTLTHPFADIQAGIDATTNGDTLLVQATGLYQVPSPDGFDFEGKSLVIRAWERNRPRQSPYKLR